MKRIVTISGILMIICGISWSENPMNLDSLKPGFVKCGFRVLNLYVDEQDKSIGARFISERHGFLVDLMQIESVPQAFIWVKTPVCDDKGIPHTCEHLLLGKGNRARYVSALEGMSLTTSTAYTAQTMTCYHFNTIAGEETFYSIFFEKMRALLLPDFTDEEIRREVCHLGYTVSPDTGELTLEEKGSVYTEMVSTFEKPGYYPYNAIRDLIYGDGHPLSNTSGGTPDGLRSLTPAEFHDFHKRTHTLDNMGAIVSLPHTISPDSFLDRFSGILDTLGTGSRTGMNVGISVYDFPEPSPAHYGTIQIVTFPSDDIEARGVMYFAWPAWLELNARQSILFRLFLQAFSSDETSNLYHRLIDSTNRSLDIGASGVWSWLPEYQGHPVWVGISGVENRRISEQTLVDIRSLIMDELKTIASFANGSPELIEFNNRVHGHLVHMKKERLDFLNAPPQFGSRGGPAGAWQSNLELLEHDSGFRKSLTLNSHFEYVDSLLNTGKNFWSDLFNEFRLFDVEPFAIGSRPDPSLLETMAQDKEKRLHKRLVELKETYAVNSEREALSRFRAEFDARTAELDSIASQAVIPGFIDDPPLTYDDHLIYDTISITDDIPLVSSVFEHMKSSTVGIALDMHTVPESLLIYVPIIPQVLTSIGVVEDGDILSHTDMRERIRREILGLDARFVRSDLTDRIECMMTGRAGSLHELISAIHWMGLCFHHPYLETENIPRIRDLVDQQLSSLRQTMNRAEETWVDDPIQAYRYQRDPVHLATRSFLTKRYLLFRIRCRLTDMSPERSVHELEDLLEAFLRECEGKDRDQIRSIIETYKNRVNEATSSNESPVDDDMRSSTERSASVWIFRSIQEMLIDLPDETLSKDLETLVTNIIADLSMDSSSVLDEIDMTLDFIRRSAGKRLVLVSNKTDRSHILPILRDFVAEFGEGTAVRVEYGNSPVLANQIRKRMGDSVSPHFVGLVHEGTRNGVISLTARVADQYDLDTDAMLTILSGKLFSGSGSHSLFMRTWGAGLAYSNGPWFSPSSGRVGYYAERCPDVAETMRFVVNELKSADDSGDLGDYVIAQIFNYSRAASRYEARGMGIATDLADGFPPHRIRTYREKILDLRSNTSFTRELFQRLPDAYGPIMIGFGDEVSGHADGVRFLIGPPEQFESFERLIRNEEGEEHLVYRLYPRDFWIMFD